MPKKMRKYWVPIFISIVAIVAIAGYQAWNKPHINIKDADGLKTTAAALYNNLMTDSINKKSMFINKVVIISGQVKQVLENEQHQQIILLKTNVPDGAVNCTMEKRANQVKAGEDIVIKGICLGYMGGDMEMDLPGDVFLMRCYYLL